MFRSSLAAVVLLATLTQAATAQRRLPGRTSPTAETGNADISVIARVGTKTYTSKLSGNCQHEPEASIYDVPAALWTVQAGGSKGSGVKQLNLTLWRPKNGSADQISLSLEAGSSSTRIEVNPRNRPNGAASITLQPMGGGGKLELRGKDAKGNKVNLTVGCPMFDAVVAEGG
jgi:hypothetical protein